jgi:hypothetical protein
VIPSHAFESSCRSCLFSSHESSPLKIKRRPSMRFLGQFGARSSGAFEPAQQIAEWAAAFSAAAKPNSGSWSNPNKQGKHLHGRPRADARRAGFIRALPTSGLGCVVFRSWFPFERLLPMAGTVPLTRVRDNLPSAPRFLCDSVGNGLMTSAESAAAAVVHPLVDMLHASWRLLLL